jgi:Phytanoyl-CoA dioxygenase (PhyH)
MGITLDEADTNSNKDDKKEEEELDSADEALLEMLGLSSLDAVKTDDVDRDDDEDPSSLSLLDQIVQLDSDNKCSIPWKSLLQEYQTTGICVFPLHIPSALIRRLTDELVWGGHKADKTYETIQVLQPNGEVTKRRTLTRLENFVDHHEGWKLLCHGFVRRSLSSLLGKDMVLFKEKLNLKPPGGSGFAPHLDGPSLRVALPRGPQHFVTIMIAIDAMTPQNGCLRVCKGTWSQHNHCTVVEPEREGNPDAGGRAGAIPTDVAETLEFQDIACPGGTIAAFGDLTPHRSAANRSPFSRRAIFLTYNPASEGDHHAAYYQQMETLRDKWNDKMGWNKHTRDTDQKNDLAALSTIPKI